MSENVHTAPAVETGNPGYDTQEPAMGLITGIGLATLGAFIVTVMLVQIYFDSVNQQEYFEKVLKPVSSDYLSLRAQEDAELNSYGYIDREKGLIRLPIDRAISLTASEFAAGKISYSGTPTPIPPPEPAAPNGTAAPATGGEQANAPAPN